MGKTDAYKEHEEKTKNYSKQKWNDINSGMDHIMKEFAFCMEEDEGPDSTRRISGISDADGKSRSCVGRG